jgi:hypothetical protein
MCRLPIFLFLMMTAGLCRAEIPKLFCQPEFNSVTLVDAANHFIAIGEQAAVKELEDIAANDATNRTWMFSRGNERIGWMCRMLFEPKGSSPLRAPNYGRLNLPEKSITLAKWPLYPVVLSGSTYFVLSEGYVTDQVPEDPKHYIEYCRSHGRFRITPIATSTREQAMKDAANLRQSDMWRSIKWEDEMGVSYPFGQQWNWAYLQRQAASMPEVLIAGQKPKAKSSTIVKANAVAVSNNNPAVVSVQ